MIDFHEKNYQQETKKNTRVGKHKQMLHFNLINLTQLENYFLLDFKKQFVDT